MIIGLGLFLLIGLQTAGEGLSARQYFYQASSSYIRGDLDGALKQARAALDLDPTYKAAWELKESVLREQKIIALLLESEKARQVKKSLAAGSKQYKAGNYTEAVASFRTVLSLAPGNKEALSSLNNIQDLVKAEERARQQALFWLTVAYGVAYLSSAALLVFIMSLLRKLIARRAKKPADQLICFNCQAKLPLKEEFCPNCGMRVGLKLWRSISEEQKRWYDRAGWKNNPFSLDTHPEFFTGHKKAVQEVLAKISARSGQILILGPLGVGKTTLLRWLAVYLPRDLAPVYISRPPQNFDQLIRHIINSLGFTDKDVTEYDLYNLDKLRHKIGKGLILLLDETHEFTIEIERPLRTLGDLDGVNLVMAGLPETAAKLQNEIKPLSDRLSLTVTLEPLEFAELSELLKARIEGAGGNGTYPFTASALTRIYELSKGIPRTALKLADAAVALAIKQGEDKIGDQLVNGVNFPS